MNELQNQSELDLSFGYALPTIDTDVEYLSESDVETLNNLLHYADLTSTYQEDYA